MISRVDTDVGYVRVLENNGGGMSHTSFGPEFLRLSPWFSKNACRATSFISVLPRSSTQSRPPSPSLERAAHGYSGGSLLRFGGASQDRMPGAATLSVEPLCRRTRGVRKALSRKTPHLVIK